VEGELLDGYLALDAGSGVLDLIAHELEPASFQIAAWTVALFGAAELLCVERLHEPEPTRQRREPTSQSVIPSRQGDLDDRHFAFSRFRHNLSLTPTAETLLLGGQYVVGHRRQLQPGQTAGARACENAALVGIPLRDGETWVKPHTRGLSDRMTLSFHWDAGSIPMLPDLGDSSADLS
jgi:hypothetical protein